MRTPRSEDDILALLAEHFPVLHPDLLVGRGDDCAVLRPGGPLAVTCDVVVIFPPPISGTRPWRSISATWRRPEPDPQGLCWG